MGRKPQTIKAIKAVQIIVIMMLEILSTEH